jgi:cobalt-zinc-cadmium efflux system outer membrane protein
MNNPGLAAFSWEVRAGDARTLQAGLLPNPELETEIEGIGGTGEQKRFDGTETTIALNQLIELGRKRSKRKRVAALERDLAGWDYETKRLDVFTEVTKAFVDLLSAQQKMNLMRDVFDLAEQVFKTVSGQVKAGKVSPIEETKARVALSIISIEKEQVRSELVTARHHLAATCGNTSPVFQEAKGELEAIIPIPPFEDLMNRVAQNPDIARWTTELEQRQATLEMENANQFPDLTIGGGIKYLGETEDLTYVMGLSIPLPLLNRNQGSVDEAEYHLAKAREEFSAVNVAIRTALHEAYQLLSTAFLKATNLKNDVLPGAQSVFDAVNEGYREGKFGYLDMLDAQRSLFDAKKQYIEALASYHKAEASIERLIGERLRSITRTPAQS